VTETHRNSGRSVRVAAAFLTAVSIVAASPPQEPAPSTLATLREYADRLNFRIGTVMQIKMMEDARYREVLGREFNSFVSFAFMRFTEPEPGHFDFTNNMDRDIAFARQHQMKLFGGSLIYRAGLTCAEWLRPRRPGDFGRSPEELDRIMKEYIETTVRHGGDDYYAWEVVDEPLSNPNQPWEGAFGRDEYIAKAFRYAREANPSAILLLNDTFGFAGLDRGKVDQFFDLIQRLKSRGAPIDAAGTEMHLEAQQLRPEYLDELRYFLHRARSAGVEAYITEMDLYQGPPGAFPDPMERQRQVYHDVLATCLAASNCKGFMVWGISDVRTWLRQKVNNPHPDAKPLLFDEQFQKKPAYQGVLQAFEERLAAKDGGGAKKLSP
jgi:endo-1,4-beta-xylanase